MSVQTQVVLHSERRTGVKTVWKTDEEDFCEAMHCELLLIDQLSFYNTAFGMRVTLLTP